MPSEKVLEQKKQIVIDLSARLNASVAGVVVDYKGINVADDTALRTELRNAGVTYTVVKNTLLHRAAESVGLNDLSTVLEGTTALATSTEDHVASARILAEFASKHNNFSLKSGFLDGAVISLETLDSLSKLPSREVLLATVCNVFNAPISAFARAVQAVVDKRGEEDAEVAVEVAPVVSEETTPEVAEAAPEVAVEAPAEATQE